MSIRKRYNMILLGAMLSCVVFSSSASSRPWKPTPAQVAGDYASITHIRGNGDFVNIGWWASPTARPGTPLVDILEKYILISVGHARRNFSQPASGISFDDIKTLEVLDESGRALTPVPRDALPPASITLLANFEARYRAGLGPRGNGIRFFRFDAGAVRACEKGGIYVPFDGETYTWETPFPGCPTTPISAITPVAPVAATGQFGNADEAKAMLAKAVAAVKADKAKALDMFNKGEGGFLDRDLYPFCFNVGDGKHLATQAKQLVGRDIRVLKDPTGKAFGLELYAAAQKPEGEITEVTYMFPKAGRRHGFGSECEVHDAGWEGKLRN
jgi:hypothetical protein